MLNAIGPKEYAASSLNPGADEKQRALEEVLQSRTFERSDQLRRFLGYICGMEISGRALEITEYAVGTQALGRPSTYEPGNDSSVRTRAVALRQKLVEFYESEGSGATLRIELHKGSYVPHFVEHAQAHPQLVPEPVYQPEPLKHRSFHPVAAFAAGAITATLLSAFLFQRTQPQKTIAPVVRAFWGPLLRPGADVLMCVASAPSMLLHSYKDGTVPVSPRIFPAPAGIADWYAGLHMADGGGRLYGQTSSNTTLFGDNLAAITAAVVLTRAGIAFQIVPEYSVRPLALRGRNIILIGSPNYSPLAARILKKTPLSVTYNPVTKLEMIGSTDSTQAPGAGFSEERDPALGTTRAYGLITVIPSQPEGENGNRILLFSGITSAGTQGALEFFSSPGNLLELEKRMQRGDSKPLPAAYQVVVRCGVDNNLALSWTYETHRVIQKPVLLE